MNMKQFDNLPEPLSKEEEYRLFQEVNEGSKEARDELIIHNVRFVSHRVMRFSNGSYDMEDLISIGNIGLIKAIDTYDMSKEFQFLNYAARCIDNEILMFLRKTRKHKNIVSLSSVFRSDKEGNELKFEDILSDEMNVVEDYMEHETYQIICQIVKDLPDRDRKIIMLYFGFYHDETYSQREIADMMSLSQSYVSRVIKRVVKKIGQQLRKKGVIELHESVSEKEKRNVMGSENLSSIYDYFKNYTREQVNEMLSKLTIEERALITRRYGEDLDHPVQTKLTKYETNRFYHCLVPKMKELLDNPYGKWNRWKRLKSEDFVSFTTLQDEKKPSYEQSSLPSSQLAAVDNPTESIVPFLEIESGELRETTKKVVSEYDITEVQTDCMSVKKVLRRDNKRK